MRYAAFALILAVATTAAASQSLPLPTMQDGRAQCIGFNPDKFSVVQSGSDWRVQNADGGGFSVAVLSSKEDADAVLAVIQKKKITARCTIGKGDRTFRYFESAR